MFEKFKEVFEIGLTSMLCKKFKNKIIVYGGSNFPDGLPPEGKRKVHNDMYIFDLNFNLLEKRKGMIYPDNGITIDADDSTVYYVLGDTVYKLYEKNNEIYEEKFVKFPHSFDSGFGAFYKNSLIFGKDKVFKVDIENKNIEEISIFPAKPRSQSVFFVKDDFLYIFSGATNICHLDAYKFNLLNYEFTRLNDVPISLTGACVVEYKGYYIIMGGFNKEVYDYVVPLLSDIEFKREYFKKEKSYFKWNNKILKYEIEKDKFDEICIDDNTSLCGSSVLNIDDYIYLIAGEIKPGIRSKYILRGKI